VEHSHLNQFHISWNPGVSSSRHFVTDIAFTAFSPGTHTLEDLMLGKITVTVANVGLHTSAIPEASASGLQGATLLPLIFRRDRTLGLKSFIG
jgi:hypothetical protein